MRLTAPIANSLSRLQKDAESAKSLAQKLEMDLVDDREENGESNGEGRLTMEEVGLNVESMVKKDVVDDWKLGELSRVNIRNTRRI